MAEILSASLVSSFHIPKIQKYITMNTSVDALLQHVTPISALCLIVLSQIDYFSFFYKYIYCQVLAHVARMEDFQL